MWDLVDVGALIPSTSFFNFGENPDSWYKNRSKFGTGIKMGSLSNSQGHIPIKIIPD